MDFNQLMARMRELDQPVGETVVPECGEPMGMTPPMGGNMGKPDTPPPSMSLNLNAQGMDNISELMKLMTKVNPDMINQPQAAAPTIEIEPMDKPAGDMPKLGGLGDLGNLDSGPLKMLPDLDAGNDDMPGGEKDGPNTDIDGVDLGGDDVSKAQGDIDNDGDHDMDDHEAEKEEPADDEEEKEAFGNSLGDSEPNTMGVDAAVHDGNDLNKPKKSFSGKAYRGDNPMAANAFEGTDLRAQIRAELLQRLAEAKGAK